MVPDPGAAQGRPAPGCPERGGAVSGGPRPSVARPWAFPCRYMCIYMYAYIERQTYIYIYFFYREFTTSRKC